VMWKAAVRRDACVAACAAFASNVTGRKAKSITTVAAAAARAALLSRSAMTEG